MRILAIDPGPTMSAYVMLRDGAFNVGESAKLPNQAVREHVELMCDGAAVDLVACEQVRSYGMRVGAEVFDTVEFSGQLHEVVTWRGVEWLYVPRLDVKLHICRSPLAKDANIRQALIDRLGGKGTKANKGPLYGVKADVWQALALAVTVSDARR